MKLTKGKISKLYNKKRQSLKKKLNKRKSSSKKRTFRRKHINLARKSLKRPYKGGLGGEGEREGKEIEMQTFSEPSVTSIEGNPVTSIEEQKPVAKEPLTSIVEEQPVATVGEETLTKEPVTSILEEQPVANIEEQNPVANIEEGNPVANIEEGNPVASIVEEQPVATVEEQTLTKEPVTSILEEQPVVTEEEKDPDITLEDEDRFKMARELSAELKETGEFGEETEEPTTTEQGYPVTSNVEEKEPDITLEDEDRFKMARELSTDIKEFGEDETEDPNKSNVYSEYEEPVNEYEEATSIKENDTSEPDNKLGNAVETILNHISDTVANNVLEKISSQSNGGFQNPFMSVSKASESITSGGKKRKTQRLNKIINKNKTKYNRT